jgi:hypothetical protein
MTTAKSCTIVSGSKEGEPPGEKVWGREEVNEWFVKHFSLLVK